MNNHVFDRVDPIGVWELLTRFVNKADTLIMCFVQAFVALPKFLADTAETKLRAKLSVTSRRSGATYWP